LTLDEHTREATILLTDNAARPYRAVVFLADADGWTVGFIEADLRSHADGCDPAQPVGYVEGWYVKPSHRGRKIGKLLLAAAEDWAQSQGCREMASDTWLDNLDSQHAHEALGFEAVDTCVHYRKNLPVTAKFPPE
jgi:aminoglycoside 6'-N-acetyltransferase I